MIASQFHHARRRAAVESLLSRFTGQPVDLLSFDEVVSKLGIRGQSSLGVKQIAIDRIVGSVGRYQDFSRTFLPRRESDEDRWVNVGAAARTVADLPPIEVYKVGESYFVLDGNHRVSLARHQGIAYIDAIVTEVRTRAPLPADANPDQLIAAAEHGEFLAETRLDILRPGADVAVSVPGQYRHLENHIEAFRYICESNESRDIPYDEAVTRWYDDAYMPMIYAIREQGIMRYFPGRTETDFFVWLARHRISLQKELGLTVTPDIAVTRLMRKVNDEVQKGQPPISSRILRIARLGSSESSGIVPNLTWAQERTLDRYSSHLFAAVLFPFVIRETGGRARPQKTALDRALGIAELEGARFYALCVLDQREPSPIEAAAIDEISLRLEAHPSPTELLAIGIEDAMRWTQNVGFINDLIIVERDFDRQLSTEPGLTPSLRELINSINRPILVLGESGDPIIPQRVLVVHDINHPLDEAIFIAAYLAERWKVQLSVLPIGNGGNTQETVANLEEYFALHEVKAMFMDPERPSDRAAARIIELATDGEFDLLMMTGPERGRKRHRGDIMYNLIQTALQQWTRSLLIAT